MEGCPIPTTGFDQRRDDRLRPDTAQISLVLGLLGAINFLEASRRPVPRLSGTSFYEYSRALSSTVPLRTLVGNFEPYFIMSEARRCRRRLFARSLFRRAPTLGLWPLSAIAAATLPSRTLCECPTLHIPSGP